MIMIYYSSLVQIFFGLAIFHATAFTRVNGTLFAVTLVFIANHDESISAIDAKFMLVRCTSSVTRYRKFIWRHKCDTLNRPHHRTLVPSMYVLCYNCFNAYFFPTLFYSGFFSVQWMICLKTNEWRIIFNNITLKGSFLLSNFLFYEKMFSEGYSVILNRICYKKYILKRCTIYLSYMIFSF